MRKSMHGGIEFLKAAGDLRFKCTSLGIKVPVLLLDAKSFDTLKEGLQADLPHFPGANVTIHEDGRITTRAICVRRNEG